MFKTLGRDFTDAVTAFVVMLILGATLFAQEGGVGAGPPQKVFTVTNVQVTINPGAPPTLEGGCTITGAAGKRFKTILLAQPVTNGQNNPYTVVDTETITLDANGDGQVLPANLVGNLPLATQGWYVRMVVTGLDTPDQWMSNDGWIPID